MLAAGGDGGGETERLNAALKKARHTLGPSKEPIVAPEKNGGGITTYSIRISKASPGLRFLPK